VKDDAAFACASSKLGAVLEVNGRLQEQSPTFSPNPNPNLNVPC
jgi:hypothetical protein